MAVIATSSLDTAPTPIRRRQQRRKLPPLLLALIGAGALIALLDLYDEAEIFRSGQAARYQALALDRGDNPADATPRIVSRATPRLLVHEALQASRTAASLPPGSPQRRALLLHAENEIATALTARPAWGQAQVVAAYTASLDGRDAQAMQRLASSYANAPFLRDAVFWRIGYAIHHWGAVPRATRLAVIEEGLWARSVWPERFEEITDLFRKSAAYSDFVVHSRDVRASGAERTAP